MVEWIAANALLLGMMASGFVVFCVMLELFQ
jgi:hypothetical protein